MAHALSSKEATKQNISQASVDEELIWLTPTSEVLSTMVEQRTACGSMVRQRLLASDATAVQPARSLSGNELTGLAVFCDGVEPLSASCFDV